VITIKSNLEWIRTIAAKEENFGFAVDTDSEYNLITVLNSFNGENYHSSVLKYDKKGSLIWNKKQDVTRQNMSYDVSLDSEDNIIIVGFEGDWTYDPLPDANAYLSKYNKNGKLLWKKTLKQGICTIGFGVQTDSDDNICLIATYFKVGEPNLACWVMKFDKNGNLLWDKFFHEHYMDIPYNISIDSDDNILVAGYAFTPYKNKKFFTGGFMLLKYNKEGEKLFQKRHISSETTEALAVTTDSKDNIIMAGENSKEMITIKTDKTGEILWERRYKDKHSHMPYALAVNSKDEIIIGDNLFLSGKADGILFLIYDSDGERKYISRSEVKGLIFDLCIDKKDSLIYVGKTLGPKIEFFISKENR
jgi:hypothetical protein